MSCKSHVTGPDGRCTRCGKIVGTFDAMVAGRYLREGRHVRACKWPTGQYLWVIDGAIYLFDGKSRTVWSGPTPLESMDAWEIYMP